MHCFWTACASEKPGYVDAKSVYRHGPTGTSGGTPWRDIYVCRFCPPRLPEAGFTYAKTRGLWAQNGKCFVGDGRDITLPNPLACKSVGQQQNRKRAIIESGIASALLVTGAIASRAGG